MRFRTCSFSASLAPRLCQLMGSARISASLASSASISARVDIVQPSVPGSRGPSVGASCGLPVLPGTTSFPGRRASSGRWSRRAAGRPRRRCTPPGVCRRPFRTVTRAPVLSSVMVSCRVVRSPRRRGSLTFIGVTLAVRVICQVRGPTTPSGVGPFSRWKATPTHVIAGQTVDPVNPRPSRHDTPSGRAAASRRYHRPPTPRRRRPRPGQAREEIDGAANQWQPAQVAIEPGGTVTFRIAGGQTHPVGSGQAPPEDRRFDASKCQPRTSPRSGTLAR